ncbi:unnamed protein product [Malus baccata var. baccata]
MAKHGASLCYYPFFTLFLLTMILLCKAADEERRVHIVYMGSLPDGNPAYSPLSHHLSILQRVVRGSLAETILVRSYKRSFNGFAANLTDQEREKIASESSEILSYELEEVILFTDMEEIVCVFPSIRMEPQTTRSWDFMGFDEKVSRNATTESDIIVGVMDTGIWPEAKGFKDEGFGPPPKKWKAWPMNDTSSTFSGVFAYGSEHIDPVKAINPGLVYETSEDDHIKLLCTVYDEGKVRLITGENITCPKDPAKWSPRDHNYPSMGAKVDPTKPFTVQFHRTVKNVGLANSTYRAKIFSNSKLDIKVVPEVLSFKSLNEQMDFDVTVGGSDLQDRSQVSGSLVWSDGIHSVRSPILIYAYVPNKLQNMVT